ncbi:MAG: heme-binding protein [Gammaproteobacteria bacterium]|nr:heme-binding protein [Gammaproteobacteria bacterium]
MALEEPAFEVVAEFAEFEVRRYEPYLVAEVDVASGNSAFRTLAGFIFGDNSDSKKMQMTAPVESRPSEQENMDTYSFVMEKQYTLDTLPKPNDESIRVLERPARVVAARRFSGRWTDANFRRQLDVLQRSLAENNIEASGPAEQARYNSPFTPSFMRRNEVIVPIEWPEPSPQGGRQLVSE